MYRIYDKRKKEFIKNAFVSDYDDIYLINKNLLGCKLKLVSSDNYVIYNSIGMCDANGVEIYEGDIVCLDDINLKGIIYYEPEQCSYIILSQDKKYYYINKDLCHHIKIISNISKESIDIL